MGKHSSSLTRVTTDDDFANATSTEEESIAFAIAALQSMPETPWRNRVNHPQSKSSSSSSSSSSVKRPRSATQAAMKTKCPTRTLRPSVSPKLLAHQHQQSAGTTNNKKAKQQQSSSLPSQPQPLPPQSTKEAGSTHKPWEWNNVAPIEAEVDAQPSTTPDAPCDTVVPPWSEAQKQHAQQQEPAEEDSADEDDGTTTSTNTTTRLARCRERNREHARKTRLRKKVALQELQTRIAQLQQTKTCLQQRVQEQSIASILLELTSTSTTVDSAAAAGTKDPSGMESQRNNNYGNETDAATLKAERPEQFTNDSDSTIAIGVNKRQRSQIVPHSPLQVRIAGKGMVTIQSQINWKTGTYMDDAGVTQQLNAEELELLRRERNRRHAKMTRDRKRSLLLSMEHTVEELERDIAILRRHQNKNNNNDSNKNKITPLTSPEMEPEPAPHHQHGFLLSLSPTTHDDASNKI